MHRYALLNVPIQCSVAACLRQLRGGTGVFRKKLTIGTEEL